MDVTFDALFGRIRRYRYVLLALITVGVLEIFTPIAPMQRAVGLGLTLLPQETKTFLFHPKVVQRLQEVESQIRKHQADHTIRTRTGKTLLRRESLQFPDRLRRILVNVENHWYWRTFVLDVPRTALVTAKFLLTGEIDGGASGIAQQAARRIVLQDRSISIKRKAKELAIALILRTRYSSSEVLTFYMATAYLGRGVTGFDEAARHYFGVPVSKLSLPQSIVLVGMLDQPNHYLRNSEALTARYRILVRSLHRRDALPGARARNLLKRRPPIQRVETSSSEWASVSHSVRQVQQKAERTVVRATVDPGLSQVAYSALSKAVKSVERRTGVEDVTGFLIAADGNGSVHTMIGGLRPYQSNVMTRKTAFRAGSAQKPLLYASFYELGFSPQFTLSVHEQTWERSTREWTVSNYSDRYSGFEEGLPAALCLSRSLNVPAARLAMTAVGDTTFTKLDKIRVDLKKYPANLIGASAVRPSRLFRGLLSFVAPYGKAPFLRYKASTEVQFTRVYKRRAAHNTALNMGLVVEDSLGTGRLADQRFGWSSEGWRMKTGTGQQFTSASLFVSRPGLHMYIGVFSKSGEELRYGKGKGVTGATLIPFADDFLSSNPAQRHIEHPRFRDVPETGVILDSPEWTTFQPWLKDGFRRAER